MISKYSPPEDRQPFNTCLRGEIDTIVVADFYLHATISYSQVLTFGYTPAPILGDAIHFGRYSYVDSAPAFCTLLSPRIRLLKMPGFFKGTLSF